AARYAGATPGGAEVRRPGPAQGPSAAAPGARAAGPPRRRPGRRRLGRVGDGGSGRAETARSTHAPPRHGGGARRPLAEHRFDLLEETLGERMHFLARQVRELLQQRALTGAQLAGRLYDDPDDLVTASVSVELGHPATLQAEDLTGLGAGGDLHLGGATQRRDVDLRTERRLREADRHLAHDVVALPHEERVLVDVEQHVEI